MYIKRGDINIVTPNVFKYILSKDTKNPANLKMEKENGSKMEVK